NGIELRVVDRFYPSSKLCHECGCIKKDLKLSHRVYVCDCGYKEDRDLNASFNLRDAKIYKIA
ncbi:zinc ribbon domain-containing protein, partial [Clostridium tarantellae]